MIYQEKKFLFSVIILSLGIRFAYILLTHRNALPFSDMVVYNNMAMAFLSGKSYGITLYPPLYPIFLACLYLMFGHNYLVVYFSQAILGALTVFLTYLIGKEIGSSKVAKVGSLIVAFYISLILYTNGLMSENLYIFLLCLAIFLLIKAGKHASISYFFLGGLFLGMAILTRTIALGLIFIVPLWLYLSMPDKRRALVSFVAIGLAVGLVLCPWIWRTYKVYGRFIPPTFQGGYNFYMGNNPYATGRGGSGFEHSENNLLRKITETWESQRTSNYQGGLSEAKFNVGELDRLGYKEGMRFILNNPGRFILLSVKKVGCLLGVEGREIFYAFSMGYVGKVSKFVLVPVTWLLVLSFPLLASFGIIGMVFSWRRKDEGLQLLRILILYFIFVYVLFYGESRFHLPLAPFLAVFAGFGVTLLPKIAERTKRADRESKVKLSVALGVFIPLAINWIFQIASYLDEIKILLGPEGHKTFLPY